MTNAHRDLAVPEHWIRSLERSRRRRELLPRGRRENNRRKHISAALATAVVAGPAAPMAAAQVSGEMRAAVAAESPANRAIEIREGGLPLQVGSQGELVAHVQKALRVTADGIFGPQTDAAVREYQASAGLEVDGIVGLATWGSLFERSTASGASVGGSDIPLEVKQRLEQKLQVAGQDLAADGRMDGNSGPGAPPVNTVPPVADAEPPVANTGPVPDTTRTPPAAPAPPKAQTPTSTPAPTGQACGSATIANPVRGTVTSNFGPRWGRNHDGIDIAAPSGTAVRAAACGTVSVAGSQSGYGNMVCITHTSQFATCYAHLSRFGVTNGAQVRQGQVIGYVGCTGSCTGPHLHFETRVGGRAQDPRGYLGGAAIPGNARIASAAAVATTPTAAGQAFVANGSTGATSEESPTESGTEAAPTGTPPVPSGTAPAPAAEAVTPAAETTATTETAVTAPETAIAAEPVVEAPPETVVAAEPVVEVAPEPVVAAEPVVEAAPEPVVAAEPVVEAAPEPVVAAEPVAEAAPAPEAVVQADAAVAAEAGASVVPAE